MNSPEELSKIYNKILIGHRIRFYNIYNNFIVKGTVMDKYLREIDVFLDILCDDGQIVEELPFSKANIIFE